MGVEAVQMRLLRQKCYLIEKGKTFPDSIKHVCWTDSITKALLWHPFLYNLLQNKSKLYKATTFVCIRNKWLFYRDNVALHTSRWLISMNLLTNLFTSTVFLFWPNLKIIYSQTWWNGSLISDLDWEKIRCVHLPRSAIYQPNLVVSNLKYY